MPRVSEGNSCADPVVTGGRDGEGQAEEAAERDGEESSRAWHASEQYIRLEEDVMRLDQRDHVRQVGSGTVIYLS